MWRSLIQLWAAFITILGPIRQRLAFFFHKPQYTLLITDQNQAACQCARVTIADASGVTDDGGFITLSFSQGNYDVVVHPVDSTKVHVISNIHFAGQKFVRICLQ